VNKLNIGDASTGLGYLLIGVFGVFASVICCGLIISGLIENAAQNWR
jgi:hypothetical protein